MTSTILSAVRHLIDRYRSFLRTSYRFLDDQLRQQFEAHLDQTDVVVKGPYVTLAQDFALGPTLRELVQDGTVHPALENARWAFGTNRLYSHQVEALRRGRAGRSFVVTTGTGSGKTESFLLPVLDGILRRKADGVRGLQAVFVYPMNALANDQVERMRRLLRGSGLPISFALYTGDSDTTAQQLREEAAETERLTRADIRHDPPDIVLTNYKQLDFMLVRNADRHMFTPALRYLVLDEIHSYRGALATEIACLIRRLKAQAGHAPRTLVTIGTSATVAGGTEGRAALAHFVSTLFGDHVSPDDIITESYMQRDDRAKPYTPPLPDLEDAHLTTLIPDDDASVVALTERLTGKRCPPHGAIAERVAAVLAGNRIVRCLEEFLRTPHTVAEAAAYIGQHLPERQTASPADVRRDVEAYLLVGSIGDDRHPPRLRPKLHTFFHGVYDVGLCLNPQCRTLVPHGGSVCPRCGSTVRPVALCRTCGQDFVKVRFDGGNNDLPVGNGDFFSDEQTGFLTHAILDLPDAPGGDDSDPDEKPDTVDSSNRSQRERRQRHPQRPLHEIGVCPGCGRILPKPTIACPSCNQTAIRMLLHRGKMHSCPTCGDVSPHGDIVTPLRTGTASAVTTLALHHLDQLDDNDRKLLIFADNRQDAAHQAGYTADKHRAFALRHAMAHEIHAAGDQGVYLTELPQRLFDRFRDLGIIPQRPPRPEQERWLHALAYQVANELTRYSRQRMSLETLGLIAVEYEGLEEVGDNPQFQTIAHQVDLTPTEAVTLTRAVLDVMRKNRALAYDGRPETGTTLPFFTEYIDPYRTRSYRELEAPPYDVRFPHHDRHPKAFALDRPDHLRTTGQVMGFIQENPRVGALPSTQKLVARVIGNRERAATWLRAVIPLLCDNAILVDVGKTFSIPTRDRIARLPILQIDPRRIRLRAVSEGYRCTACQTWRPYTLSTCPTPQCRTGTLVPASRDRNNYYVRLYLDQPPRRFVLAEHSAQIPDEERTRRETDFKEGKLTALVCTPTLELGVDIGSLMTVVLRNAPPTPANYAQRVGRAGRRLRIGFVSTFCATGPHDRHAFEQPEWFVDGRFLPPTLRLDNLTVVRRHLRSYLLAQLEHELPPLLGDLLDDVHRPTCWDRARLEPLVAEIRQRRADLIRQVLRVMEHDIAHGRVRRYGADDVQAIVDGFAADLTTTLERWWERVAQLDREYRDYATIGSPRKNEKKAAARKRAYYELTQDTERAYILNYLAMQQLLPAYQFPIDTFSLDTGLGDTKTVYQAASTALEEFAPGNFVYINGHRLRSVRVLYPGGPGNPVHGRSDAETSGRLETVHICPRCDEVLPDGYNTCPRCHTPLRESVTLLFVNAFEAEPEQARRITADEETRRRLFFDRRVYVRAPSSATCRRYPYPHYPVEVFSQVDILITNWGDRRSLSDDGRRFWLCPDCGHHLPYDPSNPDHAVKRQEWHRNHRRFCTADPVPLVLAHRFQSDCLVLTLPGRVDIKPAGHHRVSSITATLAEALRAGAGRLLELEPHEIEVVVRIGYHHEPVEQLVFYETVPGGAGYLEEMAARLPDIARAAQQVVYGHPCTKACYRCLKHYRNQLWHPFFDKDVIRDALLVLATLDPIRPHDGGDAPGADRSVARHPTAHPADHDAAEPYATSAIEEVLRVALERRGVTTFVRGYAIHDEQGRLVTVPDFAWPDRKLAVFCDGYTYHGTPERLEQDARRRNFLQSRGWIVLTFWGRTILRHADACAHQIVGILTRPS